MTSQRKRSVILAIDDLIEAAASPPRALRRASRVRNRSVRRAAAEPGTARSASCTAGAIEVRYSVDPSIRGGLVVRVGDELIDGSVASRLTAAARSLRGLTPHRASRTTPSYHEH